MAGSRAVAQNADGALGQYRVTTLAEISTDLLNGVIMRVVLASVGSYGISAQHGGNRHLSVPEGVGGPNVLGPLLLVS